MIPPIIRPLAQALHDNRDYRFWFCQLCGWVGYSLVTFLSITLVDDNISWPHVGHISLSAALGVLTSWPLRPLYRWTFDFPLLSRLAIATLALLLLSAVWTVLRVLVYAWMIGEPAVWDEVNYWFFGSVFVFLSWTVLYYGIKYYELLILEHQKLLEETAAKRQEQYRRLQAEASARDAQLRMLRYQLNPHFLFNTLNAINALVTLDENDRAGKMIQLLSDFLRHSLNQDGVADVSLEEEIESLMLYLNIEKARFEERLHLEFDLEPAALRAMVPGLILQPIVENSMKYAIAASEEGGAVTVSARRDGDELQLQVTDSGPGMQVGVDEAGRGLGLRNIRDRLETLYPGKYKFSALNTEPSGLAVTIRFPFRPQVVNTPGQGCQS